MIIVRHFLGKEVDKVFHDKEELTFLSRKPVSSVLYQLAGDYPNATIVWVEQSLSHCLNINEIDLLSEREIKSYSVNGNYFIRSEIGLIDNSVFLKINRDVKYPTWVMSSDVGMIRGEVLNAFKKKIRPYKNFDYFLSAIAKTGMSSGLLAYSDPELLEGEPEQNMDIKPKMTKSFKFVKSFYGFQKAFYLFLLLLILTKKPYIWSLLLSLKAKSIYQEKIKLPKSGQFAKNLKHTFDIIIPTIGRKDYLKQVLDDFSKQSDYINKVIIVEQNPEKGAKSQLPYLKDKWPFEIDYSFTNQPGACNARNIALQKVEVDWVFFADDDIRLPSNFFKNTNRFINTYVLEAFTLSCLQVNETENETEIIQWSSFGTSCSFVSKRALDGAKFDMGFEFGYGEDSDFGMQLRNKGVDILYNPFLKLVHLKAPVGGFRYKHVFPWDHESIKPKPSPTIMLFQQKHSTAWQILGYKATLFLKFYRESNIPNPFKYYSIMQKRWGISKKWSLVLRSNE